jgi:hypothetical protein
MHMPRAPAVIAIINLALLVAHGWAHRLLGVPLTGWQAAIVYGIIVPGPVIALVLLPRRLGPANAVLLVSMAAGLIFGVLFHYVVPSPDHIGQLPPGESGNPFRVSAAALAVAEAAGVVVAIAGLWRPGASQPAPRGAEP